MNNTASALPDHPAEPDAELPDFLLYSPPSGADDATDPESAVAMIRGVGRNLAAICGLFFVSLAALVVGTPLFTLGVPLVLVVGGFFIWVGCLVAAGGPAGVTRSLPRVAGVDLPDPVSPPLGSGFGSLR